MSEIVEFNVVRPPTSTEVESLAITALGEGVMRLTVLGVHDVPRPVEQDVEFYVRQIVRPQEGGMIIAGATEEGQSVTVRTDKDDAYAAATATLIS